MSQNGKNWRYGDHIDTDAIIAARYMNTADPKILAEYCMRDLDTTFAENVKPGDIIVAGRNFGCGSSREHAPAVIQFSGISCVIAHSFARIFFRNSINIGLPLFEIGDEVEKIREGDQIEIDFSAGTITNHTTGEIISAPPLPGFVGKIAAAGGLVPYLKSQKEKKG